MYQIGTNPNAPLGGAYQPETQQASYGGEQHCQRPWRGDGVASGYPGTSGNVGFTGYPSGSDAGSPMPSSGLSNVLSGFYNSIQNLFSQLAASFNGGSNGTSSTGSGATSGTNETGYKTATAASVGDPHLSFNGTSASGDVQNGAWNSMSSHADLIDSDSFAGGYQVATTTTTPDANGVTFNKQATVSMDGGADAVSFTNDGKLSVTKDGQAVSIASGQSLSLGNGETVTSNADGSATVAESGGHGRSISTTLKSNGPGVDVTTTATHADLGGYLVTGLDTQGPLAASAVNLAAGIPTGNAFAGFPSYATGGQEFANPSPWNATGNWQTATNANTSTTSPFTLAGYSDSSIDEELG